MIRSGLVVTVVVVASLSASTPRSCASAFATDVLCSTKVFKQRSNGKKKILCRPNKLQASSDEEKKRVSLKNEILDAISSAPSNSPTSPQSTRGIISLVQQLEAQCPTLDGDVLAELSGNWELMWTAQDMESSESRRGPFSWIKWGFTYRNIFLTSLSSVLVCYGGPVLYVFQATYPSSFITAIKIYRSPLENQSYSNNPNRSIGGRSNPILPREIQDRLEKLGILRPSGKEDALISRDGSSAAVKSSQAIDIKKSRVRNVVSFQTNNLLPVLQKDSRKVGVGGSLTVDVNFKPNRKDLRKVDVKFNSCRVSLRSSPIPVDFTLPLGPVGPIGWLRTGYIDSDIRITRGHKGSVFILRRTRQRIKENSAS